MVYIDVAMSSRRRVDQSSSGVGLSIEHVVVVVVVPAVDRCSVFVFGSLTCLVPSSESSWTAIGRLREGLARVGLDEI